MSTSDLTAADFHIGVCRACGRYGQLSKDNRVCALAEATALAGAEFFKRTRACQTIAKKRADRGW
jgi:hypothetical protein